MVKRNIRCMLLIMLAVILASGVLNGCGQKSAEDEGKGAGEDSAGKGRYVEEEISLPIKEGERAINLSKSKDGNPVIFVAVKDEQIRRCEYIDGEWEESDLDWVSKTCKGKIDYPVSVAETTDGVQLVAGLNEQMKTCIARSRDGQSGELLDIPYLEKKTEYGYSSIISIAADGGGNYWLQDIYQSKIVVVSPDTLETVEEFESMHSSSDGQKMIFAGDDGTVAANTDDGVYLIYDKDGKEQGKLTFTQTENGQLCGGKENWYMVSSEGIVRMKPGDDSREVLMDGGMGAMGSPVNAPAGIIKGQETEFFVLYQQWKEETYSFARYTYDKDVAAVPEHTLQVFGLSGSDTIQQAVIGFQRKNPDVKVEFKTSGKEAGEVSSDDIRTLNTELLSGKGADVLLLNGLPADAYIEKGVLCDLTKLTKGLMKENRYLENMMNNTLQKDGKIYGIPVKFTVPVLYGDEQIEKALDSLDSLSGYMDKNPDAAIFGVTNKEYIRDFLFQMYQEELMKADGTVDKAKMEQLLELAVSIAKNSKTDFYEEMEVGSSQDTLFSNPGSMYLMKHTDMAVTDRFDSLVSMMLPCKIARTQNFTFKSLKGFYLPGGIVGINKNTKQKEIAEEFVKYLFSEEVQGAKLDDGFPVLTQALEAKEEEADSKYADSYTISVGGELAGEDFNIDAGFPTVKEVKDLVELCKTLNRPANQDRAVWDIYQSEADKVLNGSIGAGEGAENIRKKVELYLAE